MPLTGERKTRARTTAEVSEWAIQMTVSQPSLVTSERIVALRAACVSGGCRRRKRTRTDSAGTDRVA